MVSVLLVEDRYGVDFYDYVLRKDMGMRNIVIKRLMGARCNPKIERQIRALSCKYRLDKVAIVVDKESDRMEDVVNDLESHVERVRDVCPIGIFVIQPYHEKLLCLGLGGEPVKCSSDPIGYIERLINGVYEHKMLCVLVKKTDTKRILMDRVFSELVSFLKDP